MITADFGLARVFQGALRRLSDDGDVVTIWYRAPELLLGSGHYTPAIDIWAIGCIFAEMILGEPIFMGKEAEKKKGDKTIFQEDQLRKIFHLLGKPDEQAWPLLVHCNYYDRLPTIKGWDTDEFRPRLAERMSHISSNQLALLQRMLTYDPEKRITAEQAKHDKYFSDQPLPNKSK
jgi:cyclin-dependent kinase 8/11